MNPTYRPKKYLGQNFLVDQRIQQKIIQACDLKVEDTVLEIGPGQGALTKLIAPAVKKLIGVEMDQDFIEPLRTSLPSNVEIIHADFLKLKGTDHFNFNGDSPLKKQGTAPIKIIGNIPYYISTPIIEKLIEHRNFISEAYLTVQLEFAQRLVAKPGGKDYGSLSCFAQYYADTKILFKIKNTCFKPAPQVDSCFLSMIMRPHPEAIGGIEIFLFKLIRTAFLQRRKNIVNSLKGLVEKDKLEQALLALGIDAQSRAENINLSNYIKLSKLLML